MLKWFVQGSKISLYIQVVLSRNISKGVFFEVCPNEYVPVVCPKSISKMYVRGSLTKACSGEYAQVVYPN